MYLGFNSFYKHCNRNRMLKDPTGPIGDDIVYGFHHAGQRLRELGHDMRNSKNYDELYSCLKGMPGAEYENYLGAIEDFVRGDRIKPFTAESFANVILQQIVQTSPAA